MTRHDAMLMRFQKAIAKANWPEALKAIDGLIKGQPDVASLHYNRGLVLKNLDRLSDTLQALDMALRLDPNHANAAFERGLVLFNLGQYEETTEAFRRYLERSPDDADASLNLGLAQMRLGRIKEARTALRTAHGLAANAQTAIALAAAERDCSDIDAMERLIAELPGDKPDIAAAVLKLRTQGAIGRLSLKAIRA